MPPGFRTKLEFEDDGGFPFILTAPLIYISVVLQGLLTVPAGFHTDLASIPRVLWNILPPVGAYDLAAVLHDYLYSTGTTTRAQADAVLLEAMELAHVVRWQRWAIYGGVRLGGWVTWNKYRKRQHVR